MKLRNITVLLACIMLAATLAGCQKGQTSTSSMANSSAETAQTAAQEEKQGKHHITVESVEISLSDLKAQNYTVPVYVSLDRNAGINYSEWGVNVDPRCTFTADNYADDLAFMVYYSINEAEHFIWTAWASSGEINPKTGNLLLLQVTLPRTAAAGDSYTLEYAEWSKADKPHIWSGEDKDWAESGDVTWTDGVITVTP